MSILKRLPNLLLLCMLVFVGCNDEEPMEPEMTGPCVNAPSNTAQLVAKFDEETGFWSCGTVFASQSGSEFNLTVTCGSGSAAKTVQFQLDNFVGVGTYPLANGDLKVVPGIGSLATFVHTSKAGTLTITKSESAPNKLSGTFDGTVEASDQGVTETIEITCGSFEDLTWL